MSIFPLIVVFDLDCTLWPFWVDTHVDPPFHKNRAGQIFDSLGQKIDHLPEVPKILETLKAKGIKIGVASRTGEIAGAEQLLKLFDWNKYISYKEIYPGCKITHFKRIQQNSGIELSKMLFFDDEERNIIDLRKLGVISIFVPDGMSMKALDDGLKVYDQKRKTKTSSA